MLLRRFLFVITVISIVLQLTYAADSNNERPEVRVDHQRKKNGIINRQGTPQKAPSSLDEKTSNLRSDQQSKSATAMTQTLSNFKRSQGPGSSNVVRTQRITKQPKQKLVGVPAGIVASGYFLISAWTNAGCTGGLNPRCLFTFLLTSTLLSSNLIPTLTDVQVWLVVY